ncbi:MAG TPA: response regulator transcription factor [Gemmatimonadaceae bacterium]|nr:response regulator transcription factor [Gemmatimonadaceae bacterium]
MRDACARLLETSPTVKPLRILLLEDSDADAELVTRELQRSTLAAVIERADSKDAFTTALQNFVPDVVLSDHSLGDFDSRAALELVREVRPTVPFIIVTGAITGAQSVAAIRAGAEDLVLKAYLGHLPGCINNALAVRRPLHALTERQVQVLRLVAEGRRTRDIAHRLGLSVKTIESHRGEIMKRLRVHDVVSLVRYAVRVGLIPVSFDPLTMS